MPEPAPGPAPAGAVTFRRFWAAATISSFGSAVTAVAMPVLVVRTLDASPLEVGVVNAAQLAPYAVLGLVAGVYVDRWRRRPILVWGSIGRAVALGAVPVLSALGVLQLWSLVVLLLAFGSCSVFAFAATQSLLPRLVPRDQLVVANARLDQTDNAAATLGPALGGGLVALLGAPVALVVDSVSYLLDALLNARLHVEEPRLDRGAPRSLGREVAEGVRWMYGHPTMRPMVVSTHVWFVANGAAFTALTVVALIEMRLSAPVFGLLVAVSGVAGLAGATLAPTVGRRIGSGRAVIAARAAYPVAWLLVALAPAVSTYGGVALLALALVAHGVAGGVEEANLTGYQQQLTPDRLLGRMNATRRSANRTAGAAGAVLGGVGIAALGSGPTLVVVACVYAVALALVVFSPLRAPEPRGVESTAVPPGDPS